jgi:hypothetical protein
MSPLTPPRRAAGGWVTFYAVARLYLDLARVASATCRPARAR